MFELYNDIIESCREAGLIKNYKFNKVLQMVNNKGALLAVKEIIRLEEDVESLQELIEIGREDLSVEALVLSDKYKDQFTDEDRMLAKEKLAIYKRKKEIVEEVQE